MVHMLCCSSHNIRHTYAYMNRGRAVRRGRRVPEVGLPVPHEVDMCLYTREGGGRMRTERKVNIEIDVHTCSSDWTK